MLSNTYSNRCTAPLFRQLYEDSRHGMDLRFRDFRKRIGPDLGSFNFTAWGLQYIMELGLVAWLRRTQLSLCFVFMPLLCCVFQIVRDDFST